jgi:prevent-host-death family protein
MAPADLTISASEFKAKCLGVLDKLAARKLKRVVVTKRGRPVAVLTPPAADRRTAEDLFGCMKGRIVAPEGFDFTAPVLDGPWNAEKGILYEP